MRKHLLLSLAIAMMATNAVAGTPRSLKRGFGENTLSYTEDLKVLAKGCSWWYNWGTTPPAGLANYMGKDKLIEFVPMAWTTNFDEAAIRKYYQEHPEDKYLLGFNEPNFKAQSNLTPTQAAQVWPKLEKIADDFGLKLVSPAVNYPDGEINDGKTYQPEEWLEDFIAKYKELWGKEPHIDYIALHCYMNYPSAVQWFVDKFYDEFHKPVWLTEFCCWEYNNGPAITKDIQEERMLDDLTRLEKDPKVFRYAWFKARNSNTFPYYNLVEFPNKRRGITAGTLTNVGFSYVNMSRFDSTYYYNVNEQIPANQFVDMSGVHHLAEGYDPKTDSVDVEFDYKNANTTYQIKTDAAGEYSLLLRATVEDSIPTDSFPTFVVKDANGNVIGQATAITGTSNDSTYSATPVKVQLAAGEQRFVIEKVSGRKGYISSLKVVKTVDETDPFTQTAQIHRPEKKSGAVIDPGDSGDNDDINNNNSTTSDLIKITDPEKDPFKFSDDEKYYCVYLDDDTRKKNISDDRYVNLGDNGTTQNSYSWENTFGFGDNGEDNSFGVTGGYRDLIVQDKGWSGLGYSFSKDAKVDLSGINNDYSLHLGLMSKSTEPVDFQIVDGKGHTAHLIFGTTYMTIEGNKHMPIANFARDGKWHNIDIPMSFLKARFGLCFGKDSAYSDNNFFIINAGGTQGTEVAFDAVFFHGPKDGKPDTEDNAYDIRVKATDADKPFTFYKNDRYYLVYLDGETKKDCLKEDQIVDCGPNGNNRQLYTWKNTITFGNATSDNSFGVGSAYMDAIVADTASVLNWSGCGYNVAGDTNPLNLTGINANYTLHFAVKSTYDGPIEFNVADGMSNNAHIVLGKSGSEIKGQKAVADFPRDGKWYEIDVPMTYLQNKFGIDYSSSTNFVGNIFSLVAGSKPGTEVGYDAVFFYGPKEPSTEIQKVNTPIDDRKPSITKASEKPFDFKDQVYYVIYLDPETRADNLSDKLVFDIGPNESTRFLYPWSETVKFDTPTGENSFGSEAGYMSAEVTDKKWSGMGYFIKPGSGSNLSGITSDYTLHFAVRSTSDAEYRFTFYDSYGRAYHINLGKEVQVENEQEIQPVGDFPRNGEWYNVDIPVSWLMRQGLDFYTTSNFSGGNIFTISAGGVQGTPIDFDGLFFYGSKNEKTDETEKDNNKGNTTAIDNIKSDDSVKNIHRHCVEGIYDLMGHRLAKADRPGLYIINGKKVVVR